LESEFQVGVKKFGISIDVSGSRGTLEAKVKASVDSLSTDELSELLKFAEIATDASVNSVFARIPKVTLRELEVEVTASRDASAAVSLGFAAAAKMGCAPGQLDASLTYVNGILCPNAGNGNTANVGAAEFLFSVSLSTSPGSSTTGQLIMGVRLSQLELRKLIPAPLLQPATSPIGSFTMPSVALVATVGAGGEFKSSELTPLVKTFYSTALGKAAGDTFTVNLASGLNLISYAPPPFTGTNTGAGEGGVASGGAGAVANLIKKLHLKDGNVEFSGTMSIPKLTGGTGPNEFTLAVALPEVDLSSLGNDPWLRRAALSLNLELTTSPSVILGMSGLLTVRTEKECQTGTITTTDLQFSLTGALSASSAGFAATIAGRLRGVDGGEDGTASWEQPLCIDWLTIKELGLALSIGTQGISFLVDGNITIGEAPDVPPAAGEKPLGPVNIGVVLGLTFVPGSPVPTNIVFEGSSTTGITTEHLLAFAALLGVTGLPSDSIPKVALKPLIEDNLTTPDINEAEDDPLLINFALRQVPAIGGSPKIPPGFRMQGALEADTTPADGIKNLQRLAEVKIDISLIGGIHIFGKIPGPFTLFGFTLGSATTDQSDDVVIDLKLTPPIPPPGEASFKLSGTIDATPWGKILIDVDLSTAGIVDGLMNSLNLAVATLEDIKIAWATVRDAINAAISNPTAALAAIQTFVANEVATLGDNMGWFQPLLEKKAKVDGLIGQAEGELGFTTDEVILFALNGGDFPGLGGSPIVHNHDTHTITHICEGCLFGHSHVTVHSTPLHLGDNFHCVGQKQIGNVCYIIAPTTLDGICKSYLGINPPCDMGDLRDAISTALKESTDALFNIFLPVPNSRPIADAGGDANGDYKVLEGDNNFGLTATASDPDNDPLTYTWEVSAGTLTNADTLTPTFSAALLSGPLDVSYTLRVDDGTLTVIRTGTITVNNVPPSLSVPVPSKVFEGSKFTLNGSFIDPGFDDEWEATVNYGDGTVESGLTLNADKTFELNHVYAASSLTFVDGVSVDAPYG
jgi:hypothetical protein